MLLARFFLMMILLAVVCVATGSAIVTGLGYPNDLQSWILAAVVNLIAGAQMCLLAIRSRSIKARVMIPLAISLWRVLVIVAAVVIVRATKWPNYNFFVACLMGCYFPFLVLESSLSIRQAKEPFSKPSEQRG